MTTTTQSSRVPAQRHQRSEFKQYLGLDKKFGYLHELRRLPNSNAHTVRLSVPVGQSGYGQDNIKYVSFELFVKHADALMSFFTHQEAIKNDAVKVTVRFSCSNLFPKAYVAQNGDKEGQAIPYMGGNLAYLHTMKVDGVTVHGYNAPSMTPEDSVDPETGEIVSKTDANTVSKEPTSGDMGARLVDGPPIDAYESDVERDPIEGELMTENTEPLNSEKEINSPIASSDVASYADVKNGEASAVRENVESSDTVKPDSASTTDKPQVKRGAIAKGKSARKPKASKATGSST